MMSSSNNFNLYALTLQPPQSISNSVAGNFSEHGAHEFCVVRGQSHLELLKSNPQTNKLETVCRENAFGKIRNIASLRLTGHRHDLLCVVSDSGKLAILKFNSAMLKFDKLYCETFGKTGVRRSVPGEYLAVDPQGRCLMLAAVEKEKLVFATNRDSEDKLYVASPLEAHKQNSVTFALVALDVGFDNPVFASLETSYEDAAMRQVVLYEVDLGLNHVVRKFQRPVSPTANRLIALQEGQGVIVCSEDGLEHVEFHSNSAAAGGRIVPLPRRDCDSPTCAQPLITATCQFSSKDTFFILLQSERGDIFKLTDSVLQLSYLDTCSSPSVEMCLARNGQLLCASEFGNHELFEIAAIADQPLDSSTFTPRKELLNLELVATLQSAAPITQFKVSDMARDAGVQQIYTLCGRANQSSLRILRQGLEVVERGIFRFPMTKTDAVRGVWTVRASDALSYILLAVQDTTRVFAAHSANGEDTIEEDTATAIIKDQPTVAAGGWHNNGREMLQITTTGWRRIDLSTGQVLNKFSLPTGSQKKIDVAVVTSAQSQFCFGVTGGEVVYFEADSQGVPQERGRIDMGLDVSCLDCDREVLAIGCWDNSVRVLQLPQLAALSSQKFPARPNSLALIRDEAVMRLEVGLQTGVLVRSILDLANSGAIVDTRSHVLGNKPVRVQCVWVSGKQGHRQRVALCCSSRIWLAGASGTSPCPLSYRGCDFAAQYMSTSFSSGEGLVFVGPRNVLSLGTLEGLAEYQLPRFNQDAFALDRTPRRLLKHPKLDAFIVIEGDADSYPSLPIAAKTAQAGGQAAAEASSKRPKSFIESDDMDLDEDDDDERSKNNQSSAKEDPVVDSELAAMRRIGYAKQEVPTWSSCIRVLAPFGQHQQHTLQRIQLDLDEFAVSLEHCRFASEDYVFVGTVLGLKFHPTRTFKSCQIRTYRVMTQTTNKLEYVHTTQVNDIPSALCFFDGRLLCGSGSGLTLYELGKLKLLRKCEARNLPSLVSFIKPVSQDRIVVGDANDSVLFLTYSKQENLFSVFADDVFNRMCTVGEMVDANTCAVGDKFGNLCVLRLPAGATGQDPKSRAAQARTGLWEAGSTGLAPHKLETVAHYYVGEVVTALQKVTLAPARSEVLLYGTVNGTVGAMMPFASREDLDFFSLLEVLMRRYFKSMVGRDHLQFRSYYAPVKNTVDGDLCETFPRLPLALQQQIAKDMDRTVEEISRRLEEQRWQLMW